ncbi:MAG: glycosyltransferase [Planctomycetota bacterium]|jgi:glycosyltransferase involved in cell wall biosynthesis
MQDHRPSVSAIIPCYNAETYVALALESVLSQTQPPAEVIVVDDGSTDGSAEVAARAGRLVKLISQKNSGRAGAIATGLQVARGELVAFLDADDLWAPHMLEIEVETLLSERAGLVYGRGIGCDENGQQLSTRFGAPTHRWALPHMLCGNQVCGNTVVVRRSVLDRVGGFVAKYWPCDDYHLWLRVAAVEPFAFVDEVMTYYRQHGEQISQNRPLMIRREMSVIRDFLNQRPDVLRTLSPELVRRACVERFIERGIDCFDHGRQRAARTIFRECLKRAPRHSRVLRYALLSHLPWSWYARLALGTAMSPSQR